MNRKLEALLHELRQRGIELEVSTQRLAAANDRLAAHLGVRP